MDPVNKWITVVIIFMAAVLIVLWKAQTGSYEFVVQKSTLLENHSVVYVLDKKSGEVQAKLVDETELTAGNGVTPRARAQKVFEIPSNFGYNRY
jgi:hypothetical protein